MESQFSRLERMIGTAGLARLRRARVVVAGLGAVGGYAVEALARFGVGRLRVVDFDRVRPSNLNRQLLALHSTVGQSKAQLAAARARDINPACDVEPLELFIHADTMDQVLAGDVDLVIDAIDSFSPKLELLAAVLTKNLPAISCMGAALRTDPTAVRVGPLEHTIHCPLARRMRKALRKRNLPLSLPCVHSIEPVDHLPPAAGVDGDDDQETYTRGRLRRSLGSLPTLTGIFGLTLANEAVRMLLGGKIVAKKVTSDE
ncbi:MAG: tRNA threonylcarbamoyladenosine dehydratase [Phycisphaerae bacterium]|nr:tRNA threonylcarbamoyladenosine dehydratase [Phycisphaerae bacterium]